VQLRHTLPDGSWHIDWMLAREHHADHRVITFRLPDLLETLTMGDAMPAQRLPDHRRAYLQYEGPVSGDRGDVVRLRDGVIESWIGRETDDWRLVVRWNEGKSPPRTHHLRVRKAEDGSWSVVFVANDDKGMAQ
jgi:hypothetical protein